MKLNLGPRRRRGASGGEYALLLGLIAVTALLAISGSGDAVGRLMGATGNAISGATGGTPSTPAPSGPSGACLDERASCAAHLAAGCTVDGVYTVTGLGAVNCNMTTNGGGWSRCLNVQNTAAEDLLGNSWFDACVAMSNDPGITGNQVWLRALDSAGGVLYSATGTKTGTWSNNLITSSSATGQFGYNNHDRLITLSTGHYLKITGKSTSNSGCGGDHGNGYGIFVHTNNTSSNSENLRLLLASYIRPNSSGARSFGAGWTAATELSFQSPTFSTCASTMPGILDGRLEFYLK